MSQPFTLPRIEPVVDPAIAAAEHAAAQHAALEEARAAGYEAGLRDAQQQTAEALAMLADAARGLTDAQQAMCDAVEPAIVSLAIASAEQVIGAALEVRPELVAESARVALRRIIDRERVTILANPDDLEQLRQLSEEAVTQLGGIESIEVQAERRVPRGGVVVRTPSGDVDARLETRLEQLREEVRDALAG